MEHSIENKIKSALDYIKLHHSLVEIKALSHWRSQGILKSTKKCNSDFVFDKEIEFVDGTKVIVWI